MDFEANILDTLYKLCGIRSTSGTEEEASAAHEIHSLISGIGYFEEHPENLRLIDIEGDILGRKVVSALYECGKSKKTVILLSHFDVVGVEEYGHLKEYAYNPVEYTQMLMKENIPEDARMDLESGNWLFGRGTMDMKCGLAIHIEILRYIYESNADIAGNILLITVPDEENSSAGMLKAVEHIASLQYDGYEFQAVINSEPYFEDREGSSNRYIYTGAIGKLLPFIFTAGLEAHVVEEFSGISSTLISSTVASMIEGNTNLCDRYGKEVSLPPACLKQYDIKPLYSVTLPAYTFAYYNYFTYSSSPKDVLLKFREICSKALDNAVNKVNESIRLYSSLSGVDVLVPDIKSNVLTYNELLQLLYDRGIPVEKIKDKYYDSNMDTRDMTGEIVMEMLKCVPDLRPVMVIGFAPPYYPHRVWSKKHKQIMDICSMVIERSEKLHNEKLIRKDFFPGLCDLSYLGFEHPDEYISLESNMPVFGVSYTLPVKALSSIDIGGINISTMGKDAHKYTERLNIPYSTKVAPDLVLFAIKGLLSDAT